MKKRIAKKIIQKYTMPKPKHTKKQIKKAFDLQIKLQVRLRKKYATEIDFVRNIQNFTIKEPFIQPLLKKLRIFGS